MVPALRRLSTYPVGHEHHGRQGAIERKETPQARSSKGTRGYSAVVPPSMTSSLPVT